MRWSFLGFLLVVPALLGGCTGDDSTETTLDGSTDVTLADGNADTSTDATLAETSLDAGPDSTPPETGAGDTGTDGSSTYTVGGTVTGLGSNASVVLEDNGGAPLTVSAN